MLDLGPIKARLHERTPPPQYGARTMFERTAASDIAALIAEVERLRAQVERVEADNMELAHELAMQDE